MRPALAAILLLPLLSCAGPSASSGGAAPAGGGTPAEDPQAVLEREMAEEGIYPEHRPTRVTLKDHRSGVTIGLLNQAVTDTSEYYSSPRSQLDYKVVPDLDMGALLKQLDEFGFFGSAEPGSARVPGARRTVQVERAGQTYTLAYTTQSQQPTVDLVVDCAAAITYVYNRHQAYQVIENDRGAEFFEESTRPERPPGGSR